MSLEPTPQNLKERILRVEDVKFRTGLSRSALYRLIEINNFPKPISLGTKRSVGWIESEIDLWVQKRISESRDAS